ncbi:MAG: prefoldin subunit alpha [Candidatus Bathyarchaeota archaeon]|nr:MAG: prefoldin subunit alpha [Candidatus Bathyarchaeota archaeon]
MSEDEEVLRRLILELRILEGRAGELQARLNVLNAFSNEVQLAQATLDGLKEEKSGIQVLLPVGGGSFVKAVIDKPEKVLVGVGAGISIEKKRTEAVESLQEQQNQLESARQSLQQQTVQVVQRISEIRAQVNDLYRKVSEGTQSV